MAESAIDLYNLAKTQLDSKNSGNPFYAVSNGFAQGVSQSQQEIQQRRQLEMAAQQKLKAEQAEFEQYVRQTNLLNASQNTNQPVTNTILCKALKNNPSYTGAKPVKVDAPIAPPNAMMSLVGGGYGDAAGNPVATPPPAVQSLVETAQSYAPQVQQEPRYSMGLSDGGFKIQDNQKEQQAFYEKAASSGTDPYDENGNLKPRTRILSEMAKDKVKESDRENRIAKNNNTTSSTRIRQEFINRPEVKEFVTASNYTKVMEDTLDNYLNNKGDKGSLVALDQALISPFNKLLDPTSVTMVSEYARTSQDTGLYNRFIGGIQKLQAGGAGLTDEDRIALVKGAKIIQSARANTYNQTLSEYEDLAGTLGLDPAVVTRGMQRFDVSDSNSPSVGTVEDGYIFKGGNPADPNSWEKQ